MMPTAVKGSKYNWLLCVLVLLTMVSLFIPLPARLPAFALDASWVQSMSYALSKGMLFGQDIIFTYGPYAPVSTKMYAPGFGALMMFGGIYLALAYSTSIVILMEEVKAGWIIAFCLALVALSFIFDPVYFSLPLVVGLVTLKLAYYEPERLDHNRVLFFVLPLLFSTLGLLPLIKASMMVICGIVCLLSTVVLMLNKKRLLAAMCLLSPLVAMPIFWLASGQPIAALPHYIINMQSIISGYSYAMVLTGGRLTLMLFLLSAALLLRVVVTDSSKSKTERAVLTLLFLAFFFMSFKEGYVRQDGHELTVSTALILASFFMLCISRRRFYITLGIAIFTALLINKHYISGQPRDSMRRIMSVYAAPWQGLTNTIKDPDWMRKQYQHAMQEMKIKTPLTKVKGTSDIYSFSQSDLFASGNTWAPRPVIQSYSAYTPKLALINKNHLLHKGAPQNIFFKLQPIDGRVPSFTDGASWSALLSLYQPQKMMGDFLYLKRRSDAVAKTSQLVTLATKHYRMGESVAVPHSDKPLYASIDMEPSLFGRLYTFLFRARQISIEFTLKDGSKRSYNFIPNMAKADFLLSPLVQNTQQFARLYQGVSQLKDETVTRMVVVVPRHNYHGLFWQLGYTITYKTPSNVGVYHG
ncbi:MAG: hypothetical protein P1U34_02720 [Coxiellaceae bacterium]|nr:hypothetical protein [Coxiellaceae bacterium]